MSEFLHYVLWELRRYSVLVILAGIAVLCILGVFLFWYRKKHGTSGKIPWKKVFLILIFCGYLMMLYFATNLRISGMYRQVNLHLFRAWREAWNDFSVKNWANVLLNIGMFVPLGFLLPLIAGFFRKWYVTVPVGLVTSGAIELMQLAFIRGICDVDDLFCNTLGCAVGYFAVMVILSAREQKGKCLRTVSLYGCALVCILGSIGSIFIVYDRKEFGNLPDAAAYTLDTTGVEWSLDCTLSEAEATAGVYRNKTRTKADCDAFAESFEQVIGAYLPDVSYYQEAAYYMNHGSENGAHFLFVHYLDQRYEYSAIYDTDPEWAETDRQTIEQVLEKYPLYLPENAEFAVEGEGWHSFRIGRHVDGGAMYDGMLRVRYGADGLLYDLENQLLKYEYYRDVEIISPREAYQRLQAGKFRDGDFFEMKRPRQVTVQSFVLEYRIDTKGFYQPVYVFTVASPDGDYQDKIMIPARK